MAPRIPESAGEELDRDAELVWASIRLSDVEQVITDYELWKWTDWYGAVNWARVVQALDEVLNLVATDGLAPSLLDQLSSAEEALSERDRAGLWALVWAPIDVTPRQLHNGGHRLTAMLRQGVEASPALVCRSDAVPGAIYPLGTRHHNDDVDDRGCSAREL